MLFRETARAKVNLTLTVLGRRADGYHDIESLVTFASVGDGVMFRPGEACRVTTSGPFATAIEGPNLLERTLALLRECDPGLALGAVELDKNLPVAAGLGGGSADAAALLRAVRRANPERAGTHRLARPRDPARRRCSGLPRRGTGADTRHRRPDRAVGFSSPVAISRRRSSQSARALADGAGFPSARRVFPLSRYFPG